MSEEASQEVRDKIVEALESGRVVVRDEAALERINLRNPDLTVTEARLVSAWGPWDRNEGGILIEWSTVSAGFGELSIVRNKDGTVKIDSESMSRDFVKSVLAKLVDDAVECQ